MLKHSKVHFEALEKTLLMKKYSIRSLKFKPLCRSWEDVKGLLKLCPQNTIFLGHSNFAVNEVLR